MISAIVLLGTLNGDQFTNAFHHTNHILLAHAIGTDGTDIRIGHIEATTAKANLRTHLCDYLSEMLHFRLVLLQQMQNHAQGSLLAYAGQFGKFINGVLQ
jgi:hypothetical protein